MPYIEENVPYRVPYQIYLDPTNLCNFKCHFCPTGNKKLLKSVSRPAGMMKFQLFEKFISDLSNMVKKYNQKPDGIFLFKDGEPTLNPDLPRMIEFTSSKNLSDCVHITTNASLMTPELSEKLINAGLNDIRFSVYGVDDISYFANTKRKVDFDKIYKNIKNFWNINKSYGYPVKVHTKIMNIYSDNQIDEFKKKFNDISSEVFVEGFHKWSNSDKWKIEEKEHLIKKTKVDFICAQPFSRMTILFNGDVTPCCVDWSHDLVVANINDHSLDKIWNKMTNELRRQHIHNDFSESSPCFDCDYVTKRTKYDRIYNKTGKLNKIYNC
jgi:radical SAM protein with 4Fe4S-binding SPASM domain